MYGEFSDIYDQLMDDFDYDKWTEHYIRLIENRLNQKPERIIECACGTGSLTVRFAAKGMRVIGIDCSKAMLRKAEQKARVYCVKPQFVHQDMRKLAIASKADALLCTCDGMNYLLEESDVKSFLKSAFLSIKDGGVICFDFSTIYKLKHVMGNAFFGEERDGIATLWSNRFNDENSQIHMDITFFVREEDGRYRRIREEQRQRAHRVEELKRWLEETGFIDVEAYGEYGLEEPNDRDLRIHMIASKPVAHKEELIL